MRIIASFIFAVLFAAASHAASFPSPDDWRDENIYFIFTDRFNDGDPANNNVESGSGAPYAPTNSRGIHGGDFKGIEKKVDYLKALGATAIWITPIPWNIGGSAYHGYGARDFYQLAPHLGTMTDLSNMVAACHSRGIKVMLDVVVNHSGNLLNSTGSGYPNYKTPPAGYVMQYSGSAQHAPPFNITNAPLTSMFHTNGVIQDFNSLDQVEKGELSNLDDFNTQLTYVRTNMANIYKYWIQAGDLDGFRIDTVKHVDHGNGGFWNYWCPEMHNFATSIGKSNFFMFGEVYDGSDNKCGLYTGTKLSTNFSMDSVADYPLYFMVSGVFASATANSKQIEDHYNAIPANYDPAAQNHLVTFLDNHDQRRFLNVNSSTNRLNVALTFLYTARGIPCLYYGTEQAFNGGTDPNNREDMFDGAFEQTASLGDNFNMAHPLFRRVALLNNLRRNYPALRLGNHVNQWNTANGPGLFAYSRRFQTQDVFVVFNTAASTQNLNTRPTIYPAGTRLVNLLNTNELITVTGTPEIPSISVPSFGVKVFVETNQFQALDPVVVGVTPTHGVVNIATNAQVVLRFSKPMNTNSVQSAFSLTPGVTGTFTWSGKTNLTFTSTGGLQTGRTNVVIVGTGAVDDVDGKPFFAPFESYFVTAGTPTADTTPPTVLITAPANGAQLTGIHNITGTATDTGGTVTKVEVRVNGGNWATVTGTTAWSFSLDTTKFLNGSHTLATRSTDSSGNMSTMDLITVNFFNPPGNYLVRLSAGNQSSITDCSNLVWNADQAYTLGSFGYVSGTNGLLANAIAGACADADTQSIYQHERFSTTAGSYRYLFDCPEGVYETTLLEVETWTNAPNGRVFNVFIEGEQVLTNFDIFVEAGGKNIALTRVFTNTVNDAQLEIQFFSIIDNARASGIQVRKIAELDSDGDGIPDWWTLGYFDHPTGQAGDFSLAADDPDGDGRNNLQEFQEGTNPLLIDSPPQPVAPSQLAAANGFENQVRLTWQDNSTNEQSFAIQRSFFIGGPWTPVASVNAGVTNLTDCAVEGGITYFYRALATNSFGASPPSNIATVTTPATNNLIAYDRASHYGAWTSDSNGGTGFGAWRLVHMSPGGFFIGTTTNNGPGGGISIDNCAAAFGLFANNDGNAVAYRPLVTPLAVGQSLRWRMDNGWIDDDDSVGMTLRTGNATNSVDNYSTNARFEFLFQGGTNNYHVVDAAGRRDTGIGFSTQALELEFMLTGPNTYSLNIKRLSNNTSNTITGTLKGTLDAPIDSFALYNRNAGSGPSFDVFFNSFRRTASPPPADSVGDGIPDTWRALHFPDIDPTGTTTNNVSCATCDPDGDGHTNLEEFLTGTNPRDPDSNFRIIDVAITGNDIVITWETGANTTNQLERTFTLGSSWINVDTFAIGSPASRTDPGGATNPPAFYRVRFMP